MPRDALNTSASNPGVMVVPNSTLSARARTISSCGSEMSAGVIRFMTSSATVAEHALGADVEDLDDAFRVGRDAREVGAVEDRALEGAAVSSASVRPSKRMSASDGRIAVVMGYRFHSSRYRRGPSPRHQ